MAEPEQPRQPQLTMLQAGRGVAALLVLLYHMGGTIFASPKFWNQEIDGGLFRFGHEGVSFFFVLSGFIILHAHIRDIGHPERVRTYAMKRLTRVYLPYWIVLFPLIAAYLLLPSIGKPELTAPAVMLNSPLLIGANSRATLAVAWTLFHEIAFYGLFAVAILHRQAGIALIVLWQLACAVTLFLPEPAHYTLHPINLLFGMGMIARLLHGRIRLAAPLAVMWAGIAAFAGLGLMLDYTDWLGGHVSVILFGLASTAFVVGSAEAEKAGRITAPRGLKLLGDASYALYLVHYPMLSVLARVFMLAPLRGIPPVIAYVLMTAICIAGAVAFHRFVEKPLMRVFPSGNAKGRLVAGRSL